MKFHAFFLALSHFFIKLQTLLDASRHHAPADFTHKLAKRQFLRLALPRKPENTAAVVLMIEFIFFSKLKLRVSTAARAVVDGKGFKAVFAGGLI